MVAFLCRLVSPREESSLVDLGLWPAGMLAMLSCGAAVVAAASSKLEQLPAASVASQQSLTVCRWFYCIYADTCLLSAKWRLYIGTLALDSALRFDSLRGTPAPSLVTCALTLAAMVQPWAGLDAILHQLKQER